ncbi:thioesterase II family protein [Nostoc sp. PCC 9305]|uniref:thioesterase II family protein n=1 Tax=Nostoc sp. PCC 9305 TaxID=296636 RepID=UPI0039C5D5E4
MKATNSWIVRPKSKHQSPFLRLFCIPYAGGSASIFHRWSSQLPPDIEVCSIQLPGREKRLKEPPFTELLPLIQSLAPVLLPYLDIPFAIFGHSTGAIVSFELVRQLRRQKAPNPVHLFVSARRAPQLPSTESPIHQLPEAAFIEKLRRYQGTPDAILKNPELMEIFLPTLRADLAINETYIYSSEPPVDCPISAFGGLQDMEVSRDDLAAWRYQTNSTFSLRMFPGNHFFLHGEHHALLSSISQDLNSALSI